MTTEESQELVPPSPERVAGRALVLAAVACRGAIENDAGNDEAEPFRQSLIAWLNRIGLDLEAEVSEMNLIKTPLGRLHKQAAMDAGWRSEGMAVLAWALERSELPDYEEQAASQEVADSLGFMQEKEDTVLHLPKLRPKAEVEALADELFTLHWRLRQYSLDSAPMDFEEFARNASFGPLPLGGLRLVERDLGIKGKPLSRASEGEWRETLSITQERHHAINWLLGQEALYSDVTADT